MTVNDTTTTTESVENTFHGLDERRAQSERSADTSRKHTSSPLISTDNMASSTPINMHNKPETATATTPQTGGESTNALERARVAVYWDINTDCPSFIPLRHCKTHQDFFLLLSSRQPTRVKERRIKAVEVRLTNAEEAGITQNPNCYVEEDTGEDAFDQMMDVLTAYSPEVRPRLNIKVEFWD